MELKETDLYKFGTTEMDKFKIIQAIVGGEISKNHLDEYTFHNGQSMPSDDEINTKFTELQAEYDAQEYARNRQAEFPSIPDQLDEIYHNGIDSWKAVIKVTKDKYPKG